LDEGLSEQAFVNIIQNAYEAMGEKGGSLRVRVAKSNAQGRDGVEVRIQDSGPGIPSELREQMFNPFVTTKKTGVGLGLSIVSKIMDGHHGWIHVERAADHPGNSGASFVMFFPAVARDAPARETSGLVIS
jgi:two-component system sensor kinase FixL